MKEAVATLQSLFVLHGKHLFSHRPFLVKVNNAHRQQIHMTTTASRVNPKQRVEMQSSSNIISSKRIQTSELSKKSTIQRKQQILNSQRRPNATKQKKTSDVPSSTESQSYRPDSFCTPSNFTGNTTSCVRYQNLFWMQV